MPGEILYKVEARGEDLLVRIEERGSRRILYLDTLRAIAKESDREPLSFLIKLHLQTNRNKETLNFQRILVPSSQKKEALCLMDKTGRLSGDLPKKQLVSEPLQVFPELILTDANGSFANLRMNYGIGKIDFEDFAPTIMGRARLKKEESSWEKDLLESGFSRKMVGESHYYCPTEKVKEVLSFLLELGWKIFDSKDRRVVRQGKTEIAIGEKGEKIFIHGSMQFGSQSVSLQDAIKSRMWVELGENQVGLMDDRPEIAAFEMKKNQIGALLPFLNKAKWEETLLEMAENLNQGAKIDPAPPAASFQGELLPYQQKGVDWLWFLYRWNFSAFLADEMGLGKTVQVLAFLSRLRTNLPILIVAPTSLLFNWRLEIKRFLPEAQNISLISYTTLRLSGSDWAQKEYEVIILDESTAIKTASTQTAQAAFKLKGRFKICLNGTPMENRIDEIISQFAFLLPDLLESKADLQTVSHKVRPFILRRMKDELDLPEKIEQVTWIEMDEAQRELYETTRKGFKINSMQRLEILEAILRLRQICADPRLFGANSSGPKVERLVSDVKEALSQNRKILIYSQFTSMLQLIRQELPDSLYLDGSTPAETRGHLVQKFQEDPNSSVFLLSLKAGGVGLNLTAADYVFLYDPWWNEAVERQAIDRAHRIGQKKTVIAKRYLTLNSIEEKMLQLKEKKKEAADQLLDFEGGSLTEEDLFLLLT